MARKPSEQELSPSLTRLIAFNQIDLSYTLKNKTQLRVWIAEAIQKERFLLNFLSFNFCSDKHLLKINQEHLNHDYFTDIITFDLSDEKGKIEGDIYISLDRIRDNAKTNKEAFTRELHRVIIHGVLHLCGYKDKRSSDAVLMRKKEDYYLSLLP